MPDTLTQLEAIAQLAEAAHRDGALVVSDIGSQTVWLYASGDHPSHLYLTGPMGMASSVALGVALSHPQRPVLGICGDGALAMNLGTLVTVAGARPANLTLAVMDNGTYEYTGELPSPTRSVAWVELVRSLDGFSGVEPLGGDIAFAATGGPRFVWCAVTRESRERPVFPLTGAEVHRRFRDYCSNT
ncbi:MAG: thiamine pyrophosphate-dependent enzyme [Gammaproteobacteria bacterium]